MIRPKFNAKNIIIYSNFLFYNLLLFNIASFNKLHNLYDFSSTLK